MAEKIRVKGRLRLPISGSDPSFAQLRFAKVELSEKDILPDSADIFTCDLEGNYDFEIYTGAHLFSHTSGKEWSEPVELIVEPLAAGLSHVRISDLIGFQSIPELDDVTASLNQQKQELLAIQQDVIAKQAEVTTAAEEIGNTVAKFEEGYPSLLAAQLSKTVTVNAATGDDDTADGSSVKPFKTIKKAIESQPDTVDLKINLAGGTTKETAHVINQNIFMGSRRITITPSGNHIILDDSITEVFFGDKGSSLFISESGANAAHIHASTPKTLLYCNGESSLSFSTFHGSKIYLSDAATFTLIKARYYGVRGVSNLDASRLSIVTANGSAATNAEVYAVDIDIAGAVLVNLWSCSLGAKFNYTRGWGSHSVINGSLVVVSN